MSHELRTPMHTVLGANELMRSTSLNKIQRNYLDSQKLAAHQMLTLVDDILDTARLNSSQPTVINNQPFDLHQLLSDLEKIFAIQANQKQLDFIVGAKNIPLTPLHGDEKRLRQILTNLIGNAIKYTESGTIILEAIAGVGNDVFFAVRDTGPGIPAEHHDLLFQPFYQTDSSRARYKDGAGLGLAISYKLVQQMGGELKLDSTPRQGSCFFFTLELPVCDYDEEIPPPSIEVSGFDSNESIISNQHQQEVQPRKQADVLTDNISSSIAEPGVLVSSQTTVDKKSLSGLKILLVDDGELNLLIGKQLLLLQGAEVVSAQSGKEALQKLAMINQTFDLVLMDVSMPEMNGYQTTQLLRENKNLSTLPVIALTAHALAGEKARCLEAGMDDYLSKPFQTEQLLKLVKRHCAKK